MLTDKELDDLWALFQANRHVELCMRPGKLLFDVVADALAELRRRRKDPPNAEFLLREKLEETRHYIECLKKDVHECPSDRAATLTLASMEKHLAELQSQVARL